MFVYDMPTTSVVPNAEFSAFRWVTLDDGPWAEAPPNVLQLAVLALRAGR
jgi:hypothetical protein